MKFSITLFFLLLTLTVFGQEENPQFEVSTKEIIKDCQSLLDEYKFEIGFYNESKSSLQINYTRKKLSEEERLESNILLEIFRDDIPCISITDKHSGKVMTIYFRFCQQIMYGKLIKIKNLSFKSGTYLYDMCNTENRFKTSCLETDGNFEAISPQSPDGGFQMPPNTIIYLTDIKKHKISPTYLKKIFQIFKCY